jgi:flagellar basal body rod protein FlgG
VTVFDEATVDPRGDGLFNGTGGRELTAAETSLKTGGVEGSNVNAIRNHRHGRDPARLSDQPEYLREHVRHAQEGDRPARPRHPEFSERTSPMRSLSIAASGMLAQQTNVDVISNNIANMNTTGFKRQRAEFQDLLYEQVSVPVRRPAPRPSRPRASRSARA